MAADPFAHFVSDVLGTRTVAPSPKPSKVAASGDVNKKRHNGLVNKLQAQLANEVGCAVEDRDFDAVEAARRRAAVPDNDDDPDLPD